VKRSAIIVAIGLFSATSRAEPPQLKLPARTKDSVAEDASRVIDALTKIRADIRASHTIRDRTRDLNFRFNQNCTVSGTVRGEMFETTDSNTTATWGATFQFEKCDGGKYYFDGTASLATSVKDSIHGTLAFRIYNDDRSLRAYSNTAYFDATRFLLFTAGAHKLTSMFIGTLSEDSVSFDYHLTNEN
jgi:hypothetical protein